MLGKINYTYLLILTAYLLGVGMPFSYGQKKKDKTLQRDAKLSPVKKEDQVQAEYLFTEAVKNSIIEDYPKAISYLRRSLELYPENAAGYYKMAELLFKTDKLTEAEKSIQIALNLEQENKYYYILAADIQTQQGNFTTAANLYETMLDKTDAGPQHILELAVLYLHMHDYNKAIQVFDRAEKVLGINEQIILQKQKLYLQQNKLPEALREGEKLVENFPEEPAYVLQQVEILLSNHRYNEALSYLQNYLQENPDQPQAQYLLAKVYQQQGNFDAADKQLQNAFSSPELSLDIKVQEISALIEQLPDRELQASIQQLTQQVLKAHQDQPESHILRADFLFAIKQQQQARSHYLQALELDANNFQVWQNALSIGLELGRFDSVAEESERALELFPNQAAIYYFNGAANLSLKNYDEAVYALEQGKRISASNKELAGIFNSHLGDAYNGTGQYEKSDAAYEAAMKANPENDYILNNYSYYLSLRQEKLDLARELSEKLIKKHPDNPTYLDTHAWVLYQLKQYKEAKRYLERALENEGDQDGTIVEHYGDVLYQLNEKDAALNQWKKARQLPNTSDKLDQKINDHKLYE
jgi:tetratricopeptide (TPR) repeat protein